MVLTHSHVPCEMDVGGVVFQLLGCVLALALVPYWMLLTVMLVPAGPCGP